MTHRQKRILIVAGICFAVYFIGIFFVVSAVLTRVAPGKLADFLGRPVAIEQIRVNPLTLSVTVSGLDIRDKNKTDPFVGLGKLYVNAEALSLIKRGLMLKTVQLEKPEIHIARLSGATFNFSDLITAREETPDEPEKPSKPFRFSVADVVIADGTVVYRDQPTNKTHTIAPINWRVPFISNFTRHQDQFSEPAFTCEVDGAQVSVDVRTKPFKDTLETLVDLAVSGVEISRYTAYAPADRLGFEVKQGTLDLTARAVFQKEQENSVVSAQGQVVLTNLNMTDKKNGDLFAVNRLAVTVLPSVVTGNRLHVGEIRIESPALAIVRKADGSLNLSDLVKGGKEPAADARAGDKTEAEPGKEAGSAFYVDVDRMALSGGTVRFIDFAVKGRKAGPVENSINDLNATVDSFSTEPGRQMPFELAAKINKAAPLALKGHLVLTPLAVESDISLSELVLAWGQPYLPENVKLEIAGGRAETESHLFLVTTANEQLAATVTGKAAVRGFASAGPGKTEPFLQWSNFTVDGVKVSTVPLRVSVDTIAFNNLKQNLVIFEDGATNIAKIFVSEKAPQEAPDEAAKAPEEAAPQAPAESSKVTPIRVGRFLMNNTELRFSDRSVNPHYNTKLELKDLKVTGLTSEDFKAAKVTANGTIDGYAPVEISGAINPLAGDLFVDLDVKLANMEMAPFSSYTGKYVGRAVEKGKLNLVLKYDIKQKALSAENHILMDQFTLGQAVESPDAMNLPVGLAVALLTDRKGVIDLNLPVSGRTDDPQFRIARIVFKALGNLIAKAATSPFALVGALVGGGEEMRFIEFEPGWAEMDEADRQKLDAARKLLTERPALKLEIMGYADGDVDRRGAAAVGLERTIKAPALAKLVKKGEVPDSKTMASVVLTPEQRERALRKLYENEVEEKPVAGVVTKKAADPALTIEEMEAALVERRAVTVTDADLGLLARERAMQVKDYLLADQTLSPERVFLKAPDSPLKPAGGDFKPSRVELGVK